MHPKAYTPKPLNLTKNHGVEGWSRLGCVESPGFVRV